MESLGNNADATRTAGPDRNPDQPFHAARPLSWGRVVREPAMVARPAFRDGLAALVSSFTPDDPGLVVGLMRSYGDSNLNPRGRVIDMTGLDRFISFDPTTGIVRAEAGLSLSQCLQALVPAGWFLPTTPGSRFVTLGGAIANDVHGKNHHTAGSFGNSVRRIGLLRSDGQRLDLRRGDALFHATIGGLGLTGAIEWAEFSAVPISSSLLDAEDIPFRNVDEYFDLAAARKNDFEHTMAWIDCLASGDSLGRGIFSCANWSTHGGLLPHHEQPRKSMPIDAPGFALNTLSVWAFNNLRNALKTAQAGRRRTHYEPFLYPLDGIAGWNRLYGQRGFWQYQCVVPPDSARDAVRDLLIAISRSGQGSFLAVLKDFGEIRSEGLLSFPMPGTTLALDFPNKGRATVDLMNDLDAIVSAAGGRLYAAKDGRIPATMFAAGYAKLDAFKTHVDPGFSSAFWRRVSQ